MTCCSGSTCFEKFHNFEATLCKNAQMEDWDDLKYVLAVARYGGLSGAARSLKVNHSTVSRRLSALETRIGARLFERLPSGLAPTEEGNAAIEAAKRVETEVFALDRRIMARDTVLEGPLRVTAPQLIFQAQLAQIMARFAALNPQIELTMIGANETLNLHRREADVAIRVSDTPDPSLYGRIAVGQNRRYYASRDYMRAQGEAFTRTIDGAAIGCVTFVWWGEGPPADVLARFPNAKVSARSDDMLAVHAAVRAGMGIGRMPCFLGDGDPALVRVPGFEPTRYLDIWVLTHPDLKKVERIRRFMRFATDAFKARADLYLGQ